MGRPSTWTAEEEALLRKAYETWPPNVGLVSSKTKQACYTRAWRLGLGIPLNERHTEYDLERDHRIYLAAFLDADGFIHFNERANKVWQVGFTNTQLEIIEWIESITADSSRSVSKAGSKMGNYSRKSNLYNISWQRRSSVKYLLEMILPFMRHPEKRIRAAKAIEWADSPSRVGGQERP